MGDLVLEEAENALEELLKGLLLVVHRVDEVLQLVYVCLQTIHADLFHCQLIFFLVIIMINCYFLKLIQSLTKT